MNLIFNAFAYLDDYNTSVNMKKDKEKIIDSYLRCCCVSLISAKEKNPDCDVAIVTNIKIPKVFDEILQKKNIKEIFVPYDSFRFAKEMKWSLAFYKLCALQYVVEKLVYDEILMVDTDTYFNGVLDELWLESQHNIMLIDIQHRLFNQQTQNMNKQYSELYNQEVFMTNYGGEFICGSKMLLNELLLECKKVYSLMINKNVITQYGDEFILCCAAARMKNKIKSANAYISRYWTYEGFYLVSTNYAFNPVDIWHLPAEKDTGFQKIFKYYLKYDSFPKRRKLWRIFGFPNVEKPCGPIHYVERVCEKVLRKIGEKLSRHRLG